MGDLYSVTMFRVVNKHNIHNLGTRYYQRKEKAVTGAQKWMEQLEGAYYAEVRRWTVAEMVTARKGESIVIGVKP